MKSSEDGFSLVESMAVSAVLVLLVSALMVSFYLSFSKMMIRHVGYRTLVCLAAEQPARLCKKMAKKKLKLYLPIGKLSSYRYSKKRGRFRVYMKWNVVGYHYVEYKNKLRYGRGY